MPEGSGVSRFDVVVLFGKNCPPSLARAAAARSLAHKRVRLIL